MHSEHNGIAKSNYRNLVEGLTLLFQANLLLKLWVEAFITAAHLIN